MASFVDGYIKLIKRFFPLNRQSSSIGLDVGLAAVRSVEITSKNGVFELVRWGIEPLAANDDKAAAVALGKTATALGPQAGSRPVVASVGGKGTLVRYVDMPRMSTSELRRAFEIESDKYFPFPKDTVYTDCHILDTTDNNRKMAVLVSAVKKDLVDGRMKLLKDAGMDPATVTLASVAMANAFAVFPPEGVAPVDGKSREFKASAVLDIGETCTNLMIIFAGLPRFNRDVFIGTQEIYKRVSNLLGVPPQEVPALLQPGMTLTELAQKGVDAVMANLIAEIRLSFEYFVTEKNLAVTRIFLAGEGAQVPGVEKAFKDGMDIPVSVWNPLDKMPRSATAASEGLKAAGPRLVTALGLALNEYDQS
ncbi:MAG: type IV pilus assembly protein PilM [Candidatus Omnitrophota bacterium]